MKIFQLNKAKEMLKEIRENNGSQETVAKKYGIDKSCLSKYETGKTAIATDRLAEMMAVMKENVVFLWFNSDDDSGSVCGIEHMIRKQLTGGLIMLAIFLYSEIISLKNMSFVPLMIAMLAIGTYVFTKRRLTFSLKDYLHELYSDRLIVAFVFINACLVAFIMCLEMHMIIFGFIGTIFLFIAGCLFVVDAILSCFHSIYRNIKLRFIVKKS